MTDRIRGKKRNKQSVTFQIIRLFVCVPDIPEVFLDHTPKRRRREEGKILIQTSKQNGRCADICVRKKRKGKGREESGGIEIT